MCYSEEVFYYVNYSVTRTLQFYVSGPITPLCPSNCPPHWFHNIVHHIVHHSVHHIMSSDTLSITLVSPHCPSHLFHHSFHHIMSSDISGTLVQCPHIWLTSINCTSHCSNSKDKTLACIYRVLSVCHWRYVFNFVNIWFLICWKYP